METNYDNYDYNADNDLENIIRINQSEDENDDVQDYDFDYDPNEMYFALLHDNN